MILDQFKLDGRIAIVTGAYSFCWGMGGENQAFDDMDHLTLDQLR